jgi:anti-sigma factor RsiW
MTEESIQAFADGEVDANRHISVQDHIDRCSSCAQLYDDLIRLKREFSAGSLVYHPSPELYVRVCAAMRQAVRDETRQRTVFWRPVAVAASIALAVLLGWNLRLIQSRGTGEDLLTQELLASHTFPLRQSPHRCNLDR